MTTVKSLLTSLIISAVLAVGVCALPVYEFTDDNIRNFGALAFVTVDGRTHVVTAADNVLVRLDENLTLLEAYKTGPACQSSHLNVCPDEAPLDVVNRASVLVADQQKDLLLYCGTAYYGRCSVHRWDNLAGEAVLLDSTSATSFIGSAVSSRASFRAINRNDAITYGIFAAVSYDQRPVDYYPLGVSTLTIRASAGKYSLNYMRSVPTLSIYSGITIAPRYRSQFVVEYVHDFEYKGFQYYLAVQKASLYAQTQYKTVLQRVQLYDYSYVSYVEIPLQCSRNNLKSYNIATAGYLGTAGPDLAQKAFSMKAGDDVLFVTSVVATAYVIGDVTSVDRDAGSALCMYKMADVVNEFKSTQINCYSDMNSLATRVPWMIEDPQVDVYCDPNNGVVDLIRQSDDFGGERRNPHIRGLRALEDLSPLVYDGGLMRSVAVTVRRVNDADITIAIVGTDGGQLMKYHLGGDNWDTAFAVHSVSSSPIHRQMLFDSSKENIFVMTTNKVIKFPVHSCRVYGDCATCVTAQDRTVQCGWCHFSGLQGNCTERDECKLYSWTENSCQPIIKDFTPKAGPTAGGTPLTIYGSGFGNPALPDQINLNVKVGLGPCKINSHTFTEIQCVTGSYDSTGSLYIAVHAVDKTTSLVPYVVDGTAMGQTLFTVMSAVVERVWPRYGPISGGTNLTLTGTNLNIGGAQTVALGHTPCITYSKENTRIECTTRAWSESAPDQQSRVRRSLNSNVSIVLKIDGASIVCPDDFIYMDDPVITNVSPRTSFISGGLNVTILGENLQVVQRPRMVNTIDGKDYISLCEAQSTGQTMTCVAPDVTSAMAAADVTNVTGSLSFIMDGVQSLREFGLTNPYMSALNYVPDPLYEQFDSSDHVLLYDIQEPFLSLKGMYLDMACQPDDVVVLIGDVGWCNVTTLTSNLMTCVPMGRPSTVSLNEPMREVWVRVGRNLKFYIGDLRYVQDGAMSAAVTGLMVIMILLVLGACLGLFYCYRRRLGVFKRYKSSYHPSPPQTVLFSHNGGVRLQTDVDGAATVSASGNDYEFLLADEYAAMLTLLDNSGLRVHRQQLTLVEKVGEGHFGCVWRGLLDNDDSKNVDGYEVAVKTHRSTMGCDDVQIFLTEAMIMRDFEHMHVLSLIGICLDREKGPMVVLPFMHHGDLHTYISNPLNEPSVRDLMDFGLQIARGMEYLCEKKFVHRDLAARNCMLDEHMLVKVADFGLARDVYEKSYYRPLPEHAAVPLPVRWMAFECFEQNVFTTKSDVWAFGVVLWELMTRGIKPYPDVMDNWDILRYLQHGRRLGKPQYCPQELYEIMLRCWDRDADERPSATQLVQLLIHLMTSLERRSAGSTADTTLYENVPVRSSY